MAQFFLISGLKQHELPEDKIKKLDLASMFSDKLLKEINISKEQNKQISQLGKQLIKLILKISFQQKKMDRFREFLINYPHAYEIYDLERIQNSYLLFKNSGRSEDKLFLVRLNYERFRKDLDIDSFIAQFKIYKDYISDVQFYSNNSYNFRSLASARTYKLSHHYHVSKILFLAFLL